MMLGLPSAMSVPSAGLAGLGGLGDLSTTLSNLQWAAPDGYFSTWDISQWGIAEWGTGLVGIWTVYSVLFTTQAALQQGTRRARKIRAGFTS